jgi:hypothetical protein
MKRKIKVGRRTYKISQADRLRGRDKKEFLGTIDYCRKEILIKRKQTRAEKDKTLYHEIAHALFFDISREARKRKAPAYLQYALFKLRSHERFIDYLAKLLRQNFKLK